MICFVFQDHKLRNLDKFVELPIADQLSKAQKIGLKHFDDFEKRIPRQEIEKVEELIKKHLANIDQRYRSTICGSYRRGLPTSGDIDMLVTHPTFTSASTGGQGGGGQLLKTVVEVLETEGILLIDYIPQSILVYKWES